MRCFWDEASRAHAPHAEFFNGALHPAADVVERVDSVLAAIGRTETPPPRSEAELLVAAGKAHRSEYLDLLRVAWDEWQAAGRSGDILPYAFPISTLR